MPQGFGYGAVGKSLMGVLRGNHGRAAQFGLGGAMAGAGYGAISDRQTMAGGALSWGMKGAVLGAGGRMAHQAYGAAFKPGAFASKMSSASAAKFSAMGARQRGWLAAKAAGKAEYRAAKGLALSS